MFLLKSYHCLIRREENGKGLVNSGVGGNKGATVR